MILGWILFNLF